MTWHPKTHHPSGATSWSQYVPFTQSVSVPQPHLPSDAAHTGRVTVVHALAFVAEQSVHSPVCAPEVMQTGCAEGQFRVLALPKSPLHDEQKPACTSQIGDGPRHGV